MRQAKMIAERSLDYSSVIKNSFLAAIEFNTKSHWSSNKGIAKGLLLACQYEGGEKNEIQVRQDDLANTFGVSRVSMGKILKQLECLGLIKRGYGSIKIPDLQALDTWVKRRSTILTLSAKAK